MLLPILRKVPEIAEAEKITNIHYSIHFFTPYQDRSGANGPGDASRKADASVGRDESETVTKPTAITATPRPCLVGSCLRKIKHQKATVASTSTPDAAVPPAPAATTAKRAT